MGKWANNVALDAHFAKLLQGLVRQCEAMCTSPDGYAIYHYGRFGGLGLALNQLDHPLDPTNKTVNNYSVESTEPVYTQSGNVVLDAKGEAWVMLPDYTEATTKDFRYQLTPIGSYAPLFVAQEVAGNRFKIGGGTSGMKVSWTVTGSRNDLYVQKTWSACC